MDTGVGGCNLANAAAGYYVRRYLRALVPELCAYARTHTVLRLYHIHAYSADCVRALTPLLITVSR
jgi:hypothetical protein